VTAGSTSPLEGILELRDRATRDARGLFLAEGVRALVAAVEAGAEIVAIVTAPRLLRSPIGQQLARRLRQGGVEEIRVDPETFRGLSRSSEPQGIAFVARQRWSPLPRPHPRATFVAVDALRSPGNLGTLLRTMTATATDGLFAVGPAIDPWDPSVVRTSMGGHFAQTFTRTDAREVRRWADRHGVRIVGASPHGSIDYREIPADRPIVVALGSERHGLGDDLAAACEIAVRIPMAGRTDSLNVAVAGSLLLYEIARRRPAVGRSDAPNARGR
jgi:TrmH family RNA methyltransferase